MSIPKVIHYCWFGGNPKPKSVVKCIESWKKFCPDYEIIEWNESNFDINCNLYCKQAYECKKWAFVSDYARLWIIYKYGGVYLDTDVELIKPIDDLLVHRFFIGRQEGFQVNTGSGFGAVKGHKVLKIMLDDYENIPFIKANGELDLWTCPHRNSRWLFENGLRKDDSYQVVHDVTVFPIRYFNPMAVWSREIKISKDTYSIHHCDASWNPDEAKAHGKRFVICKLKKCGSNIVHLPNRVLRALLGKDNYEKLKMKLKG